jgi:hypothetical protein
MYNLDPKFQKVFWKLTPELTPFAKLLLRIADLSIGGQEILIANSK